MSKVYKGFRWIALDKFGQQLLTFVLFLVIAARLGPEEFGIYAFCLIVLNLAQLLQDLGIGETIIKLPKKQDVLDTCFYTNISISLSISLIVIFGAELLSNAYGLPEAAKYVKLISISIFIKSFIIVQDSILKKDLNYKKLAIRTAMAKVISSVTAVVLVYMDFGVYALIAQSITFSFFSVIFIWYLTDWRPTLSFNYTTFKRVLLFSTKFFKTKMLSIVSKNSDTFIIGYFFGATVLGTYTVAFNFVKRILQVINSIVLSYAYPLMTSKPRKEIPIVFKKILRHLSFFSMLVFGGMLIYSAEIIEVILGEKWRDAAFYIQILSVYAIAKVVSGLSSQTLKAINLIGLLFKIKLVSTITKVALLWGLSLYIDVKIVVLITFMLESLYMVFVNDYFIVRNMNENNFAFLKIYLLRVVYLAPFTLLLFYRPTNEFASIAMGAFLGIISITLYTYYNQDLILTVKNVIKVK